MMRIEKMKHIPFPILMFVFVFVIIVCFLYLVWGKIYILHEMLSSEMFGWFVFARSLILWPTEIFPQPNQFRYEFYN